MARKRRSPGIFLSTDQIKRAIMMVGRAWESGGRVALIGGAAMNFYGSDRFTRDVDFVADDTAPAAGSGDLTFSSELSFGGARYVAIGKIPVDIIVRKDGSAALYAEALDRAEATDENFLIVSPEYLAAMKFDAMRAKDETDLLWLLSQKDLIDLKKTEEIIQRHMGGDRAAREFRQIVSEAEWRAGEGEFQGKGV